MLFCWPLIIQVYQDSKLFCTVLRYYWGAYFKQTNWLKQRLLLHGQKKHSNRMAGLWFGSLDMGIHPEGSVDILEQFGCCPHPLKAVQNCRNITFCSKPLEGPAQKTFFVLPALVVPSRAQQTADDHLQSSKRCKWKSGEERHPPDAPLQTFSQTPGTWSVRGAPERIPARARQVGLPCSPFCDRQARSSHLVSSPWVLVFDLQHVKMPKGLAIVLWKRFIRSSLWIHLSYV